MAVFRGVTVGTTLTLEKGKWSRSLREAKAELRLWGKQAEDSGNRAHQAFSRAGAVAGRALKVGMLAGAAATAVAGVAIVKVGTEFDQTMSKVKALTGAAGQSFDKLRDQAIVLGAKTTFSANQAAQAMSNLGAAGFSTTKIMAAMPGVLDAAAASGEDMASTSEIMVASMNGFGLKARDMAHIADVLAAAANSSSISISDIGLSMKYVAPIARTANQSIEDVAGALAVLGNNGIKADTAGTSLRQGFLRMGTTGKAAMKEIGVSAFDAHGKMKRLPDIVGELSKAMGGMSTEKRISALKAIFGVTASPSWALMIKEGPSQMRRLSDEYTRADGEAKKMGKTMRDNVAGSWENFKGSLETVAITINDMFKSKMQDSLSGAAAALGGLTLAMKGHGPYAKTVHTVLLGISGLMHGLGEGLREAGSAFIDAFRSASGFSGGAQEAATSVSGLMTQVGDLAHGVLPVLGGLLGTVTGFVVAHKDAIITATAAYVAFKAAVTVGTMIQGIASGVQLAAASWGAYKTATEGATVAQWALNTAMMKNPIGLVAGVVAIAAGALVAWKLHSDNQASSADLAAAAEKRRLDAMRAVHEYNLASRSGSFAYIDAVKREKEAIDFATAARKKMMRTHSPADQKAYAAAGYEAARATAIREEAEKRLGDTLKSRADATTSLRKAIDDSRTAYAHETDAINAVIKAQGLAAEASQLESEGAHFAAMDLRHKAEAALESAGVEKGAMDDLGSALRDHQNTRRGLNQKIKDDEEALKNAVARSQGDMQLILKNTGKVTPEFKQYTQGVIDNLRKAGILTDVESAAIKKRLEKGLDNAKPTAKNVASNFQTAISSIFGGLKIPDIVVPIKAAIKFLTGGGTGDGGDPAAILMGLGGAGMAPVPKGVDSDVGRAVALAQRFHLATTSMLRPGATTLSGNRSDHATGHAGDFSDGVMTPNEIAYARAAVNLSGVKQVIGPIGFGKVGLSNNGGAFSDISGTPLGIQHRNHVHVAMYQRGTMGVVGGFGDGDKVPALLEPGEGVINRTAVAAMGGPSAIHAINAAVPRFQSGGMVYVDGYTRADGHKVKGYWRHGSTKKGVPVRHNGAGHKQVTEITSAEKRLIAALTHDPKPKKLTARQKRILGRISEADSSASQAAAESRARVADDPKLQLRQAVNDKAQSLRKERTVEAEIIVNQKRVGEIKKALKHGHLSAKAEAALRKELDRRRESITNLSQTERDLNQNQAELSDSIGDLHKQIADAAHQAALDKPRTVTELLDAQIDLRRAQAEATATKADDIAVVAEALAEEAKRQGLITEAFKVAETDSEKASLTAQMAASIRTVAQLNGELKELNAAAVDANGNALPSGTTLDDLAAQLGKLADTLQQAYMDENGNVFGRITVEKYIQQFSTPVAPSAALQAFQFRLQQAG